MKHPEIEFPKLKVIVSSPFVFMLQSFYLMKSGFDEELNILTKTVLNIETGIFVLNPERATQT